MPLDWATFGVDLHLDLPSGPVDGRRVAIERGLRDAIRSGRLAPGARLPSSRALATSLGISRGTVSAAYDQLVAEGFLAAHTGSGTVVASVPAASIVAPVAPVDRPPRYDLRPGSPDVSTFPAAEWLRAMRKAVASAPMSAYDYGDPRGSLVLRTALAEYLGRTRGVVASPDRIVITSGYVQALSLLASVVGGSTASGGAALARGAGLVGIGAALAGSGAALGGGAALGRGAVAIEDPGLAFHRDVVRQAGAHVVPLPVDELGAATDRLGDEIAAVLTPAHQYPTGVTLHPSRRHAAIEWARRTGGLLIEDDYDGEFRYDRQPVGALQGMAPDQVAYVGTASKTLGPALRLGWMVLPAALLEPVVVAKRHSDLHTETLGQLALAEMIASHAYDRHVRACRLRYRRRRDLLLSRLGDRTRWGSRLRLQGIAAGLHVLLDLPVADERDVIERAARSGLAVGDLASHWHDPGSARADRRGGLVIGYGTPTEGSYPAALDTLVRVLRAAA